MLSLYNIYTVARYETKILLRSWFFRIFSVITIVGLTLYNMSVLTDMDFTPWSITAISAFIPYYNILILNVIQAVIGIFLASEFLKRDRKLDTTEVIYIRSMTNGDYVLGKTLGIVVVFILLNLLVLAETLLFNVISKDVSVNFYTYIIYPLIISLPTLIFIFGLSFFLMVIIRNQAVTFIVLLAYVALTTFYLGNKLHFLLDYMSFRIPLAYSDFTGFGDIGSILMHRGIYLFIGLGFIFATILFIKRLPQSNAMKVTSGILAIVFIGLGFIYSAKYILNYNSKHEVRKNYLETNDKYANELIPSIKENILEVNHKGNSFEVKSKLTIENNNNIELNSLIFSLNPKLKISSITSKGGPLAYSRVNQVIEVILEEEIYIGESIEIEMIYHGSVDEHICYLDADTGMIDEQRRELLYNIDKKGAFISSDYVLLTQEVLWYPIAGVGYSSRSPFKRNIDFTIYSLSVKTSPDLTAISQGKIISTKKGEFIFENDQPLSQISLIIGNYEKLYTNVDSVEYALYRLPEHHYYDKYLSLISDTINPIIADLKEDYERKLGLQYPYQQLSIVEVPVHFNAYQRRFTLATEFTQPQMILIPENGFSLRTADFKRMAVVENEFMRRFQQDMSKKEKQVNNFKQAVNNTLAPGSTFSFGRREENTGKYSLFPTYYTYISKVQSNNFPVISLVFESYLNAQISSQMSSMRRRRTGISSEEKANMYLQKGSFSYFIDNEKNMNKLYDIIKIKGDYLFSIMKSNIGSEEFLNILHNYITNNTFSVTEFKDFLSIIEEASDFNYETTISNWYLNEKLPRYLISGIDQSIVLKNKRKYFQYLFKVTNQSDIGGYIKATFSERGRFGRSFGINTTREEIVYVAPNQTMEVGIHLERRANMIEINTFISQNIPNAVLKMSRRGDNQEKVINQHPFEGERILDIPVSFIKPGVIVVDNENQGFSTTTIESGKLLSNLFESDDERNFKYKSFNFRGPDTWELFSHTDVYGDYIRSAYHTRSGKGDLEATWKTVLTENGNYDVFAYLNTMFITRRRGRDRSSEAVGSYTYTISHDDGEEKIELNTKNMEDGWNFLGTYYFTTDTAKISLSNQSSGKDRIIMFADAVKWVKK